MASPFITNFGDEAHEFGETGLIVDGQDFGFFPGELWMFENADRTGAADQLTVGTWGEQRLTGVAIPASPNNSEGVVFLAVLTENMDWSSPAFPFQFNLIDPIGVPEIGSPDRAAPIRMRLGVRFPFGGFG